VSTGKLYSLKGEPFVVGIDYQLLDESPKNWWGEFVLAEYKRLRDGDGYVIEFEDGRKGKCFIQKRVNRAVIEVPPLYRYHFKGSGPLE